MFSNSFFIYTLQKQTDFFICKSFLTTFHGMTISELKFINICHLFRFRVLAHQMTHWPCWQKLLLQLLKYTNCHLILTSTVIQRLIYFFKYSNGSFYQIRQRIHSLMIKSSTIKRQIWFVFTHLESKCLDAFNQ